MRDPSASCFGRWKPRRRDSRGKTARPGLESRRLIDRFDIHEYKEVSSTNDVVKQAATDGVAEGLVVCARRQTAGYGRRGNRWESEPGSLYMSMLLRPVADAPHMQTIPLVAAVAVRRALASFLPEGERGIVKVKWPNDVVVAGDDFRKGSFRKICGISVEQKAGAVCLGIGVNVADPRAQAGRATQAQAAAAPDHARAAAPAAGRAAPEQAAAQPVAPAAPSRNTPTYMCELLPEGACPAVPQVRDAILSEFAAAYDGWQSAGFSAFRDEFVRHSVLEGLAVRVDGAPGPDGEPVCGRVEGVTEGGHLLVFPKGESLPCEIAAGSITILA